MTDTIVIKAPAGTKARWVRQSQRIGMKLSDWVIQSVDGQKIKEQIMTTFISTAPNRLPRQRREALLKFVIDLPEYSVSEGSPERNQPAYTLCFHGPRESADPAIIEKFRELTR